MRRPARGLFRLPARVLTGAALFAAFAITPAHALSDNEARKAILELRGQLREVNAQLAAQSSLMREQNEQNIRARLQLADQIDRLQREVMQLRGDLEQASRPQLGAGGANRNAAGGAAGAATGNAARSTTVADAQEQNAYDGAIDRYRNGQYQEASDALAAFLMLYGHSTLAPSARFYLGSSLYAIKDFPAAITQLQTLVAQHPQSARAPDALLVIAGSQFELNDREASKVTLQRIITDYANTPAAETAARRLQLL